MVRRYSYGNKALMGDTEIYEEKDGEFVLYSDYATLKEALRECVRIGESLGCTDLDCQHVSCAMLKKAREVLGDA
jgi:hypothetical protein